MINVDRRRVPVPLTFRQGGKADRERWEAQAFFAHPDRQRRFSFMAHRSSDVSLGLNELFCGKCAYCESRVASITPLEIEMYRPKGAVAESPSHPGYYWLAADWANLLLSCPDCNRKRAHQNADQRVMSGKANRFPLVNESSRAHSPLDDLALERPLLLNPCLDDPEEHLVFDWSGKVVSDTPRGQTTIAVLGLNRAGLVAARARAAREVRFALDLVPALGSVDSSGKPRRELLNRVMSQLDEMTRDDAEYAGMKRQLLRPELAKVFGREAQLSGFSWNRNQPDVTRARRSLAKKAYQEFEKSQSSFSLSDEQGRERSKSQRRNIERISVRNFKGIRSLDLDLVADGGDGGWLMLLGENSTGKSSILQAIALCLAGADYFATLVENGRVAPSELVNASTRARKATVSVKLTGFVAAHEVVFTRDGATFKRPLGKTAQVLISSTGKVQTSGDEEARQVQFVMLCYGATRLLPRGNAQSYGQPYARIDNLFDSFLPLFDADAWLVKAKRAQFDEVALALKDLLSLDADAALLRAKGKVHVNTHGGKAPIKRLSDGFQAVVAMSIDILEVAVRLWGTPRNAEGIVLLDEIGAHLHPTWKMRIVGSLRRAFPLMQFIASTHDPLCLRGLGKGEVVVMKRGLGQQIEAVTGLPSPADFRVDQLLTSEFFGLNSTVDPGTEAEFDAYYALLALPDRTVEQDEQLQQVRGKLEAKRLVGETLREQLMFEAVDRVIARHRAAGDSSMPVMKQEATDEIARLWDVSVTSVLGRS